MLCTKFQAQQTKFELLYALKSQKRIKKPLKRHIARILQHMTTVFNSKYFNTINIPNSVVCQFEWQTNEI